MKPSQLFSPAAVCPTRNIRVYSRTRQSMTLRCSSRRFRFCTSYTSFNSRVFEALPLRKWGRIKCSLPRIVCSRYLRSVQNAIGPLNESEKQQPLMQAKSCQEEISFLIPRVTIINRPFKPLSATEVPHLATHGICARRDAEMMRGSKEI